MDVKVNIRTRREGSRQLPVLVWRLPIPTRACSSAPHGGGIGLRRWVLNAQVPASYGRRDPDHHLAKLGVSLGLPGRGVGMLTAADVSRPRLESDGGVQVVATVGLGHPVLAAAAAGDDGRCQPLVGTINVMVVVPERLTDGALVNAVGTATEAKVQALGQAGLAATGTATDVVCVICPGEGRPQCFAGPRSLWGSRVARAVHAAVLGGAGGPAAGPGRVGPGAPRVPR